MVSLIASLGLGRRGIFALIVIEDKAGLELRQDTIIRSSDPVAVWGVRRRGSAIIMITTSPRRLSGYVPSTTQKGVFTLDFIRRRMVRCQEVDECIIKRPSLVDTSAGLVPIRY